MPVVLATWEAEIRKIPVQGQPREIGGETPSPNMDWWYDSSSTVPALQV
jgi:hypothetical protein